MANRTYLVPVHVVVGWQSPAFPPALQAPYVQHCNKKSTIFYKWQYNMTYLDVCCSWTVSKHQACQNKPEENHNAMSWDHPYPASDVPPAPLQAAVATHSPFWPLLIVQAVPCRRNRPVSSASAVGAAAAIGKAAHARNAITSELCMLIQVCARDSV